MLKSGDKVTFSSYGVIEEAEVLRVNGRQLLLWIDDHRMCTMLDSKVRKVN